MGYGNDETEKEVEIKPRKDRDSYGYPSIIYYPVTTKYRIYDPRLGLYHPSQSDSSVIP